MGIEVSFYQENRVATFVRTAEIQGVSTECLVQKIKQSMRFGEKFACFRSPDGRVVALNHSGEYITI